MSQSKETLKKNFYLTTAINYTNGPPHIGHCFEAILADVLTRFYRLFPDIKATRFQTGTDEHGLKIAQTAEKQGLTPKQLCDKYATIFKQLANDLDIDYNHFVRTTDDYHQVVVVNLYRQLLAKDDIYLGEYEGWYLVREETHVTDLQAEQWNYLDPVTGKPLTKVREPSYFFRLSRYHEQIQTYIQDHPEFIVPESKRQQILTRLKDEPLRDLSISRTTFDWGIPVPDSPGHCLYVWLDALINYYSGLTVDSHGQVDQPGELVTEFWPPDIHVIGKDIVWFHAVIWPGILLSAELALPKQLFVHDFIVADDGKKISKTLGNVIDLDHLLKTYPVNTLRYYLLKESRYDGDLRFSEERLVQTHNSELADKLGNLVHRILAITKKYAGGQVPECLAEQKSLWDIATWLKEIKHLVKTYHFPDLLATINEKVHVLNQYLVTETPWTILNQNFPDDKRSEDDRQRIIRTCLEGLFLITVVWQPLQPSIAETILKERFNLAEQYKLDNLSWNNLTPGGKISTGQVLYKKFDI